MQDVNEQELKIMFHTLGYDFSPRWNDTCGGYRNDFFTNEDSSDGKIINGLISKGYMYVASKNAWNTNSNYYSCTDKAKDLVIKAWKKKKAENKPSRSKRRYQAYLDWADSFDGSFHDFLCWLKVSPEMKLFPDKHTKIILDFKKDWEI